MLGMFFPGLGVGCWVLNRFGARLYRFKERMILNASHGLASRDVGCRAV